MKKITELEGKNLNSLANGMRFDCMWCQFHHCQAWFSDLQKERYILIRSYNTIVGLVDTYEKVAYELGKYSRTTSNQFTRIMNERFRGYERVLSPITNW